MKKILVFGDSIAYGVGGANGGWVDKLKLALHKRMFEPGGLGEIAEVYCLGKPGGGSNRLLERIETELKAYGDDSKDNNLVLLSVGVNDSKGVDDPENIKIPPEQYGQNLAKIFGICSNYSDKVLCVGFTPCDENRVHPKTNPHDGSPSYFSNVRIMKYEAIFGGLGQQNGFGFLPLFDSAIQSGWQADCLYIDGLHPNDKGYDWILSQVSDKLAQLGWLTD